MGYYCSVGQQCLHSLPQENEAFVGGGRHYDPTERSALSVWTRLLPGLAALQI